MHRLTTLFVRPANDNPDRRNDRSLSPGVRGPVMAIAAAMLLLFLAIGAALWTRSP